VGAQVRASERAFCAFVCCFGLHAFAPLASGGGKVRDDEFTVEFGGILVCFRGDEVPASISEAGRVEGGGRRKRRTAMVVWYKQMGTGFLAGGVSVLRRAQAAGGHGGKILLVGCVVEDSRAT